MQMEEIIKKISIIEKPFSKRFFLEFIGTGEELSECISKKIINFKGELYSLNKKNDQQLKIDSSFTKVFFESIYKSLDKLMIHKYKDLILNKDILLKLIRHFNKEEEYSKVLNILLPNIKKTIYWGERLLIQKLLININTIKKELSIDEYENVRFYTLYAKIIPFIENQNLSELENEFEHFLKEIKSKKLKVELLNLYGIFYINHGKSEKLDLDKAETCFNKGIELCTDDCVKLRLLQNKASILKTENKSESLKLLQEGEVLITSNIDEYDVAKFYFNYALILYENDDDRFQSILSKARTYANNKYPDIELLIYEFTSNIFLNKADFDGYFNSISICLFLSFRLYSVFFKNIIFNILKTIIKYENNYSNVIIEGISKVKKILLTMHFKNEYYLFKTLGLYLEEKDINNEKYKESKNNIKNISLQKILDDVIVKIDNL
ncbi:hypothetical protein KPL47_22800 [Clostridium estertheticum]|uniref:hypothetical protein n=1 Tax=Clostridium TaxID=1485 RepID=UPI001C0C7CB8|nr:MULTISPECIES: hypothetical protein [Clostridium]MBU3146524.1 hypothetical protein [Clostridium sp. CF012]MBU3179127.1 hypothetical protein [Clostridium estertheticum]